MSEAKLADASLLLQNGRHSNAYYLAGYSVEIGIKAVICKQILPETLPDRRLIEDVYRYGHDLNRLIKLAGLSEDLEEAEKTVAFKVNWSIVSQWSEASRYEMIDAFRAVELLGAIGDSSTGVHVWLKQHW